MLTITNPTEAELESTLKVAFQHLLPNETALRLDVLMQSYRSGDLDLRGVFQAKHEGTLVGAMYAQCRPDGSVMLWVPSIPKNFSLEPMIEPLVQYCLSKNAFAAVALADRQQIFDEQTLCSAGQFRFLSELIYLAADLPVSRLPKNEYRLQFSSISDYAEDVADRLTRLVKQTYQNALDFPELMQIAPVELVVQGYKTASPFRPELWFFVQREGIDIGTLLLTDVPPDQMELTYMGLLESARGQGFAKEIVHFAQSVAVREKRTLLLTSVDEKNIPACQSYLSQGFKAWDRKKVYVRFF